MPRKNQAEVGEDLDGIVERLRKKRKALKNKWHEIGFSDGLQWATIAPYLKLRHTACDFRTLRDQDNVQILTMEQFAEKMKVHLNTVKSWKLTGILRPKKDYFQIRKTVRILYGPELGKRLLEVIHVASRNQQEKQPPRRASRVTPRINLD